MSDLCAVPGCEIPGPHEHVWAGNAIDPGNEVSRLKPHSLGWVIDLLRKHPEATLARGEGGLLVAEIDRLRAELHESSIHLTKANFGKNLNDF